MWVNKQYAGTHYRYYYKNSFFLQKEEIIALLGCLMKRLMCIIETNSFAIEEPTRETRKNIMQYETRSAITKHQIGTVIYIYPSLFNHSCDPNLCFLFGPKQEIILFTVREVNKGEELNISYGPIYATHPKKQRKKQLQPYDFCCQCPACAGDWPQFDKIPRGLVPEFVFYHDQVKSSSWCKEDLLPANYMNESIDPSLFFEVVKELQGKEKVSRNIGNIETVLHVFISRAEKLHMINHPHYCHIKTSSNISTCLWHIFWKL